MEVELAQIQAGEAAFIAACARGEVDESEIGAEPVALDPIGSTEPAKQNMPCCVS